MTKSNNSQAISHSCVSNLSKNTIQKDLSIKDESQVREAFEEIRTFKEFNARSPVVFSNFGGYVSAENGRPQLYLNGALASWQEQQKKIDELQKRVDAVLRLIEPLLVCELYAHEAMKIEQTLKGESNG